MARDNTQGGLAGDGVHLQKIGLAIIGGEDEIDAHHALAVQIMEDFLRILLYALRLLFRDIGRSQQLVTHSGVFGIVIVKFIGGHHFGDSERADVSINRCDAAGKLAPTHELLHHQLVVILECLLKSFVHLIPIVHFGHAHAGAGVAGFDKARVATDIFYLFIINLVVVIKMQ